MTVEESELSERSSPSSDPSSSASGATRRTPVRESKAPRRVKARPPDPDTEAAERWEDEGGAVSPSGPDIDPPVSA
jgi:hypothetical protein